MHSRLMQSRPRDPFDKNKAVYEHQGSVSAHQVTGLQPTETLAFDRHFKTPGRVLDLGCGTGRTSVELLKRGHNVDAIDYSQSMIDEALRQHPSTQIRFAVMDARNLHFPDATFDYALFSFNGLDYLYPATERMVALRQIWRVLKPGGILLLLEHVRAQGAFAQQIQNIITPVNKRLAGNCHWNRDTERSVINADFEIESRRDVRGGVQRMIVVRARRSA